MKILKLYAGKIATLLVITFIIVFLAEWACMLKLYRNAGVKCVYDAIGWGAQTLRMVMIFVLFFMIYPFKDCYRSTVVIRQIKVNNIWLKIIKRMIPYAALYSAFYTMLVCLIPYIFTDVIWNWDSEESYVFYYTRQVAAQQPPFAAMVIACFASIFGGVVIFTAIMLFSWWQFQSPVYGYITSLIIMLADSMKFGLYFGKTSLNSIRMVQAGFSFWWNIFYPLVTAVIVCAVFYVLFRKKEMLKSDLQM